MCDLWIVQTGTRLSREAGPFLLKQNLGQGMAEIRYDFGYLENGMQTTVRIE